jgi:hypothetical protein
MGVHSKVSNKDKPAAACVTPKYPKKSLPLRASTIGTKSIGDMQKVDVVYVCELFIKEQKKNASLSVRAFCKNHKISRSTFQGWLDKHKCCTETGQDRWSDNRKGGRAPLITQVGIDRIQAAIDKGYGTDHALRWKAVRKLLNDEIRLQFESRGIPCAEYEISDTSYDHYKILLDIKGRKAQVKPPARINAEKDCRNAFSMFCLASAFSEGLMKEMVFNWDATQYKISEDGEFLVVVRNGDEETKTPTVEGNGDTNLFIKYYHLCNAAGQVSVPVLLIADPILGEEELVATRCKGGGSTDAPSENYSWVVYTKTRAGNAAFYRWYAETVVAPFITEIRNYHECKNEDGSPMRAFVTCDGEAKQIEVFQEPAMIQLFRDSLIDFGKTPASCSGIAQASDVSRFFSNTKRAMTREVHEARIENITLSAQLEKSFDEIP